MLDILMQIIVFLVKAFVIVAAILVVVAGVFAIATKSKLKGKDKVTVEKLNAYYDELEALMQREVLDKAALKERKKEKKQAKKKEKKKGKEPKKRYFIMDFEGDLKASAVDSLREEITAILNVATNRDEVILRLESCGGMVHGYGLAASELKRIRDRSIPLTVTVDKVAASGGYMMACVANKILSSPFAIIGSIGVVAQLPNFNRLLKKHDIEFEQVLGGEYKRTLTLFGENTKEGRRKFQEEIDETHALFKDFVKQNRSQIDIEKLSTGEHWLGTRAFELGLVDEIVTSDDYLLRAIKEADLYLVDYHEKKKFFERFAIGIQSMIKTVLSVFREENEFGLRG